MRTMTCFYYRYLTQPAFLTALKWLFIISLCCFAGHAFAGDQGDILAGTDKSLGVTLNKTGRNYIYIAEGLLSLAMYIKTKNLLVLTGIVVVAIFLNVVLSMSGVAT